MAPAASAKEVLALVTHAAVTAAILDLNLLDGDCSAVVERLAVLGAPVILQTGVGLPPDLAKRFPNLVVQIKPCLAADVVARLAVLIADHDQHVREASGVE